MNYPDLSKILIDTYPPNTSSTSPDIPTPSAPQLIPSAPPLESNLTSIQSSNSEQVQLPKTENFSNLYNSILKQITYSLMNNRYIVSEWSNNDGQYTSYIWFKKIFLGKINIVFTNDNNNYILDYNQEDDN